MTYTAGDWYVKPGYEIEFPRVWREMSDSARAEIDPDGWAVLLRDKENPRHFHSIGGWKDEAAVVRWRDGDGFKSRMAELTEMLELADSSVFEVVERIGSDALGSEVTTREVDVRGGASPEGSF